MAIDKNRYTRIIEHIFLKHFKPGDEEVSFERAEFEDTAKELGIPLPKNLGDIIYSFRYRADLPESITSKAKEGFQWIIRPVGKAKYRLALTKVAKYLPNPDLVSTKIPDATPGIVVRYSLDDEQSLLAKLRYNRLIDIFTGVTCYSLQNHLKTTLSSMGGVETDEVYLGIDRHGVHYVFPVQAKVGNDRIGAVQIEQDFQLCSEKFPEAVGRPIAAQYIDGDSIALFEFALTDEGVKIAVERHYQLVHPDQLSEQELRDYQKQIRSD